MAAQQSRCGCVCGLITAFAVIAAIVSLGVFICSSKSPVYSVTIAGVAGLDPASDLLSASQPTLSPVLNLTLRIDNARDHLNPGCIHRLSTVVVTYEDAFLGRGSVPEFCAKESTVEERRVRAWGHSLDVPRFLRDQLAGDLARGEAYLDVKVTSPAGCQRCGDEVLVCSEVKIGGGPASCRLIDDVYRRTDPDDGSTD